jgi:hypothetical protein
MTNSGREWAEPDRESGFLSPRQRRFLLGELDGELSDNATRQKRYKLRKRFLHAIQDLAYLQLLSTDDLGQMVEQLDTEVTLGSFDPDELTDLLRIEVATDQLLGFYREAYATGRFEEKLADQAELAAALDHYEETGRFGVFEASVDVDLVEEVSIEELADDPDEHLGSAGALEVLDLHASVGGRPDGVNVDISVAEELGDDDGDGEE